MAVIVEATQFTGRFSALNGINTLGATRADIIRSLLTVGYATLFDLQSIDAIRIIEGRG